MEKTKLIISIKGGMIYGITSNQEIEYIVYDYDLHDENPDENNRPIKSDICKQDFLVPTINLETGI